MIRFVAVSVGMIIAVILALGYLAVSAAFAARARRLRSRPKMSLDAWLNMHLNWYESEKTAVIDLLKKIGSCYEVEWTQLRPDDALDRELAFGKCWAGLRDDHESLTMCVEEWVQHNKIVQPLDLSTTRTIGELVKILAESLRASRDALRKG